MHNFLLDRMLWVWKKFYLTHSERFTNYQTSETFFKKTYRTTFLLEAMTKFENYPMTSHWLKNSYSTHFLKGGTEPSFIQDLLGHNSSKTTEIYTYVSQKSLQKIRSPFDDL